MSYPIKYAIEELKLEGDSKNNYKEITKGFIASKCYVLESRLHYFSGNHVTEKHDVSFPYDNFDEFINWYQRKETNDEYQEERNDPKKEYLPASSSRHVVTELFDDYYEAKAAANTKNNDLNRKQLSKAKSDVYEKIVNQLKEDAFLLNKYEKFIAENTTDMEVSGEKYNCNKHNDIKEISQQYKVRRLIKNN